MIVKAKISERENLPVVEIPHGRLLTEPKLETFRIPMVLILILAINAKVLIVRSPMHGIAGQLSLIFYL